MTDETQKKIEEARLMGINTGNLAALAAFALTSSMPGGIEASEAMGQQELVYGQQLPKKGLLEHREALEGMGFTFGEEIDDVFISVNLPKGWQKKATEHSMWSHLLDDADSVRAEIFYKAAFYDRSGFVRWNDPIPA